MRYQKWLARDARAETSERFAQRFESDEFRMSVQDCRAIIKFFTTPLPPKTHPVIEWRKGNLEEAGLPETYHGPQQLKARKTWDS